MSSELQEELGVPSQTSGASGGGGFSTPGCHLHQQHRVQGYGQTYPGSRENGSQVVGREALEALARGHILLGQVPEGTVVALRVACSSLAQGFCLSQPSARTMGVRQHLHFDPREDRPVSLPAPPF